VLTQQYTVKLSVYKRVFCGVGPGFIIRRFTDQSLYGTGSVKIGLWKTRHKISVDIRIFFYSSNKRETSDCMDETVYTVVVCVCVCVSATLSYDR